MQQRHGISSARPSTSSSAKRSAGWTWSRQQLDRALRREPTGRRARRDGRRRRRPDRRPLPRGSSGDPVAARQSGAGRPATCGSSPRCCTSSAASSGWATSASTSPSWCRCPATSRPRTRRSSTRSSGWASSPIPGLPGQGGVRRATWSWLRTWRSPGRRDQPPQPGHLPARGGDRRRPRPARVGDVHDPRRACLERIGDNTVDIAEQTVFVVTGLFREFTGASNPHQDTPGHLPGDRR